MLHYSSSTKLEFASPFFTGSSPVLQFECLSILLAFTVVSPCIHSVINFIWGLQVYTCRVWLFWNWSKALTSFFLLAWVLWYRCYPGLVFAFAWCLTHDSHSACNPPCDLYRSSTTVLEVHSELQQKNLQLSSLLLSINVHTCRCSIPARV